MLRRAIPLLAVALLAATGCGDERPRPVEPHPEALVGRYQAGPAAFRREVAAALAYELRPVLEGDDRAAAEALERRLERAIAAWCAGLANVLVLKEDGTLAWHVKEALSASAVTGIRLVDLPPPSVEALYGGTWRQTAPGEIDVVFETRNGRPLRWPSEGRCRLRADGGLDISWSRDLEMSIEEAPLLPASP